MIDTKHKILETAERLIGEQGYSATSLRQIIAEAEVNLAAIHYHFGSKEELVDELIMRKVAPVNAERLARMDALEANPATLTVHSALEAMLLPMADAADRDPQFVRLMGRMLSEGHLFTIVNKHFGTISGRFLSLLRRASPHLSEGEVMWRTHFATGALAHTMCGQPDTTGKGGSGASFRARIERLIAFLDGGFQAPASQVLDREEK
jgi:AcrR family transcriptional regulator